MAKKDKSISKPISLVVSILVIKCGECPHSLSQSLRFCSNLRHILHVSHVTCSTASFSTPSGFSCHSSQPLGMAIRVTWGPQLGWFCLEQTNIFWLQWTVRVFGFVCCVLSNLSSSNHLLRGDYSKIYFKDLQCCKHVDWFSPVSGQRNCHVKCWFMQTQSRSANPINFPDVSGPPHPGAWWGAWHPLRWQCHQGALAERSFDFREFFSSLQLSSCEVQIIWA